jgi:hypothetical protein
VPNLPKPPEQRRRRNLSPPAGTLPAEGPRSRPPRWPFGTPSEAERTIWSDLWRRPIAALWHAQRTPPVVIARYVSDLVKGGSSGALTRQESELGLTPTALARLHLKVEATGEPETPADPFADERRKRGYAP